MTNLKCLNKRSSVPWTIVAVCIFPAGAGGCGSAVQAQDEPPTGQVSSASWSGSCSPAPDPYWSESCIQYTDWSGTVTVQVNKCKPTLNAAEWQETICPVTPGFVLVGGGAETLEDEVGALLTASFPWCATDNCPTEGSDKTWWIARSKDHYAVDYHKLRAYSMGLKLTGVTYHDLFNSVVYTPEISSGLANHPLVIADSIPLRIGGGAEALGTLGYGQLLWQSAPINGDGWVAQSKDHVVEDPGTVKAWYIHMGTNPPGYAGTLQGGLYNWTGSYGYGVRTSSVAALEMTPNYAHGYATTSIGGEGSLYPYGRLLTDLIPEMSAAAPHGGGIARTKDHVAEQAGSTIVYINVLRKQP